MSNGVRCFVCIEIDPQIRACLRQWIGDMKKRAPRLKWVGEDALHVTLKFCGAIPYSRLYQVESVLEHVFETRTFRPSTIDFSGMGAFPGLRKPRVLWAGVSDENGLVSRLAALVDESCANAGLPEETRPFHPHVTVARVGNAGDVPLDLMKEWNRSGGEWGRMPIDTVTLMRSELFPEGPRYTPLDKYRLQSKREVS